MIDNIILNNKIIEFEVDCPECYKNTIVHIGKEDINWLDNVIFTINFKCGHCNNEYLLGYNKNDFRNINMSQDIIGI